MSIILLFQRLIVTKYIGKAFSIQRLRASMDEACTFVEHHLPGLKKNLMGSVIVILNMKGPGFIYLLINIYNSANYVGIKAITMRF